MFRETFAVGPLQCNCTILADPATRDATVVDPGGDLARILAVVEAHTFLVKQIVVTHAHIDHIAGAKHLSELTGAPVLYDQRDLPLVATMETQAVWLGIPTPAVAPPDESTEDGMSVYIGATTAKVMHTPGHTPGSLCLYVPAENLLLAGDTLFRRSIGRTDLPGGDSHRILTSIRDRLLHLPEGTLVIPGHGAETTIGQEIEFNPFLQLK